MDIFIELKSGLDKYKPQENYNKLFKLNFRINTNVLEFINQLNIPKEYIALVTINKKVGDFNFRLKDGDILIFYPPIGGG